jgi:hypothetical protein
MHDLIALLEDMPVRHFLAGEQLLLRRGTSMKTVAHFSPAAGLNLSSRFIFFGCEESGNCLNL